MSATSVKNDLGSALNLGSFGNKVAFLSSYPPRQCGIATFGNDVIQAVSKQSPGFEPIVIAMEEPGSLGRKYPDIVKFVLPQLERANYSRAAEFINRSGAQVLCVQHEFGLYGGDAGEWLLELLAQVKIPVVAVLHTVLPRPEASYRRVTMELARLCRQVIVLTNTAQQLMEEVYKVSPHKLRVIYHGVPDVPFTPPANAKTRLNLAGRTVLSTFGLINKGKGIEYAIEALPAVVEKYPEVTYLVLGGTHPVVRQKEGESYREYLETRVQELGLTNNVRFENRYLDFSDLCRYLAATDIYLTPYLGRDQIVSGTLAYALGFGKAVISTPYLYAEEALAEGRGILTDWRDSASITTALLGLLDHPARLKQTQLAAYNYGHKMAWPNIGKQYTQLFQEVVALPIKNYILPSTASVSLA